MPPHTAPTGHLSALQSVHDALVRALPFVECELERDGHAYDDDVPAQVLGHIRSAIETAEPFLPRFGTPDIPVSGLLEPPLDCSEAEFAAFVRSLEVGERVIELGRCAFQGHIGTVYTGSGGETCVMWDRLFGQTGRLGTSITGGTRRVADIQALGIHIDNVGGRVPDPAAIGFIITGVLHCIQAPGEDNAPTITVHGHQGFIGSLTQIAIAIAEHGAARYNFDGWEEMWRDVCAHKIAPLVAAHFLADTGSPLDIHHIVSTTVPPTPAPLRA